MASISKSKAGTYRVRAQVKVEGKIKQISKQGFKTKKEAKTWADLHELGIESSSKKADQFLSDYFENWYMTYKSDKELATVYQYDNTLKTIKKYLPNVILSEFNRDMFQKFVNQFGEDHSRETVAKRKNHITQALTDAYADGLIMRNPTVRIEMAGNDGKDKKLKFLEADEFERLDQYVKNRLKFDSYLAIYIAMHTGARFSEIMALTSDDIDFENHTIAINKSLDKNGNVKSTKTKFSKRVIIVDSSLLHALKDKSGVILSVTSNGVNKTLKTALKELDCKLISFHDLRHSHTSILLSKGVSLSYVSERLGHSSTVVTQRVYSHLLDVNRKTEEEKTIDIFNQL
ncbi:tyrosine-type recombinase/integrase [Leuconostocaceae bacterium ESL0958]|nr:tyrosine-type recombinase/integrase [Leuconostocaceae bacterium ESL0958]